MIDISRGIKHVNLPDDFAQNSWENWKVLPFDIKVLKSLSKNVEIWKKVMTFAFHLKVFVLV
jgi:hypothetical protein